MRLTDWLGNEYGPGDTVIYPVMSGRSIEMQQATVIDIWTVYQCPKDYKWKRLDEGAEVPYKLKHTLVDGEWNYVEFDEKARLERRVRLQPNGKGSRNFHTRTDEKTVYVDPDGNDISYEEMLRRLEPEHGPQYSRSGEWNWTRNWDYGDFGYTTRRDAVTPKAVTLIQGIDNITLLEKKER